MLYTLYNDFWNKVHLNLGFCQSSMKFKVKLIKGTHSFGNFFQYTPINNVILRPSNKTIFVLGNNHAQIFISN